MINKHTQINHSNRNTGKIMGIGRKNTKNQQEIPIFSDSTVP